MHAFLALVHKDLIQYLANRRAVLMSLVAPILIAAFFGGLFGGRNDKPANIPVAVVDLDRSTLSEQVIAALATEPAFSLQRLAQAEALQAVRAGRLRAVITLPFTTREEIAMASGTPGATYNGYAHAFAGMGVQFILLMGVEVGIALLAMRRMGLWQRLRASPLTRMQLLGSLAGLVLAVVAWGVLTASFGLMIAAIGGTPEVTRGLAILVTLLMVMLGARGFRPSSSRRGFSTRPRWSRRTGRSTRSTA